MQQEAGNQKTFVSLAAKCYLLNEPIAHSVLVRDCVVFA